MKYTYIPMGIKEASVSSALGWNWKGWIVSVIRVTTDL